jgi:chorismate mutase
MRAIRGATCLERDDADLMREAVVELLGEMITRNSIDQEQLVSIILTGTPDLTAAFPAAGARGLGLVDVPLICAQEMDVEGALERVVRVMMHADIDTPRAEIRHVYLRGAEVLRQDIAQ